MSTTIIPHWITDYPLGTEFKLTENSAWFDYVSGVATLNSPVQAHEAFFIADLAGQWIDSVQDAPFFLRIDPWSPHPPYLLTEPFFGMLDKFKISPATKLFQ